VLFSRKLWLTQPKQDRLIRIDSKWEGILGVLIAIYESATLSLTGNRLMAIWYGFLFIIINAIFCSLVTHDGALAQSPLAPNQAKESSGETLKVLWSSSSFYLLEKDSPLKSAEIKKLLFKPLYIDSHSITFNGATCHDVVFQKKTVDSLSYMQERFQIAPEAIHYSQPALKVISTNCTLEGFSEYLHLFDLRVVIKRDGALLIFEPVLNY